MEERSAGRSPIVDLGVDRMHLVLLEYRRALRGAKAPQDRQVGLKDFNCFAVLVVEQS